METLSSVACKLYEYLYFAIVFRLSVEERVKRNWASSLSLIIAYFIFFLFFCLLACIALLCISPESFHPGWKRRGLHFENYQEDRYSTT